MESQPTRQSTVIYVAVIESLTQLSQTTLHCQLQSREPIPYQTGHYAMVTINHTARAYSFASPPSKTSLEFLVDLRPNGLASHFWQQAHVGQHITFTGPYGHFLLEKDNQRPLLFIAGSTGLAPLRAHLLSLIAHISRPPIFLIVGHNQSSDAFWDQELSIMAATHNFTYRGVIGRLTDILTSIPNITEYAAYICGSANMVTNTAETLYQRGLSPRHVHYELFT